MVESVGNEILVSSEPDPMLRGSTGNEVPVMDDGVLSNESVVLNTEREVGQSLKVEPMRFDAMGSDKLAVTLEEESRKACTKDMLKDRSEAFQVNHHHHQDKSVIVSASVSICPSTIEAHDVRDVKDNNAPNETSSCVDSKAVDGKPYHEIGRNGKIVTGDSHWDAAKLSDDSKLTAGIITSGQVLERGGSRIDTKVDADFSVGQQGSVQVAPGESVVRSVVGYESNRSSLSANTKFDSVSSFGLASDTNQRNNVDVQSIADTSFAIEVSEEVDDCGPSCDDEFGEPGLERNESSGEHIQLHMGIGVKSQEHGKHVNSCMSDPLGAVNLQSRDANDVTGLISECPKGFCEQTNESVTSEPQDSPEAAEPIRSYVPGVEVRKHCKGSEIVDSMFHDGEGPLSDDDDDDDDGSGDEMVDVSLHEGSGDPAETNMYGQENMDNELPDDVWESHNQEPVNGMGISQDEEDNAGCSSSRSGTFTKGYRASYDLLSQNSDKISVSDLVWGKVKSHPWWPGQIFHQSDSSEKAKKYYRKNSYLVAYFGDRSFAWNDASQLRPFRKHFFLAENQSSSESFQNAVSCALEEVYRRIEVGLACSCLPQDMYEKIRFQTVQNAGISKESSRREDGDGSASLDSFQPDKLVWFVKRLAQFPTGGANKLELTTAKAHLSSFYRLKGYYPLPEFQFHGGLLEDDVDTSIPMESTAEQVNSVSTDVAAGTGRRTKGALRRKHNLKDIVYHRRKVKSVAEIMGGSMLYYNEDYESDEKQNDVKGSPTPERKRKANVVAGGFTVQDRKRTKSLAKICQPVSPTPRQSFKIGDCIRRVASQLTGAPSSSTVSPLTPKAIGDEDDKSLSGNNFNDPFQTVEEIKPEEMVVVAEESSPDQLLSQLQLTACSPKKSHGFSKPMVSFFSELRDSMISSTHSAMDNSSSKKGVVGRKRKPTLAASELSEAFDFEEKGGDSYWTDMVVQNDSADKPHRGRKRKNQQLQDVATADQQQEKPIKPKRKYTKKQKGNNDEILPAENSCEPAIIKEQLDTELILHFTDTAYVPSETNLNKMFKRFGPVKESETRVDVESGGHARVIFRRGSDAEVAYSSAVAFNLLGPSSAVSYQLNYTPSLQPESQPTPLASIPEGTT